MGDGPRDTARAGESQRKTQRGQKRRRGGRKSKDRKGGGRSRKRRRRREEKNVLMGTNCDGEEAGADGGG